MYVSVCVSVCVYVPPPSSSPPHFFLFVFLISAPVSQKISKEFIILEASLTPDWLFYKYFFF